MPGFFKISLLLLLAGLPAFLRSQPLDSVRFHQLFDSIETLNHAGRYAESWALSKALYDQALADFGEQNRFTANASLALGVALLRNGEPGEAAALFQRCIDIRKALFGADFIELPPAYNALGTVFSESGHPLRALPELEEALRILKIHFPEEHPTFAQTFNNLGVVYDYLGEYDKALEVYRLSLAAKQASPDASPIQISNTLNNLGAVYQYKGELENALEFYQKSLGLLEQNGLQNTQEYVLSLMNLGTAWFLAKNKFLSRKFLDAANERADAVFPENHFQKGSLKLNLGINFLEMGEPEKAGPVLNDALAIFRANFGEGSYFDMPCMIALGHIFLKKGQPDSSLVYFRQAVDVAVANLGDSHTQTIMAMNNLGTAYDHLKQIGPSIGTFRAAIANYEKKFAAAGQPLVPTLDYLDAHVNLANMLLGEYVKNGGDPVFQEIQAGLERCFSVFNAMKSIAGDHLSRQALVSNNYTLVEIAIKAESYTNPPKAFDFAEQNKAWNLLATVNDRSAKSFAGVPPETLEQERNLKNRVAFFEKQIAESIDNLDFATVLEARSQADSLSLQLENLKRKMEQDHPEYFDLKYDLATLSVPEIQQKLLRPGEALLEYFVGDSVIYIFVVTPEKYHLEEVKRNFPLETWVDSLRNNIYKNRSTGSAFYVQAAAGLYDQLVRPVEKMLPERLVIIPDGLLGYIPFEALLTERPENPKRYDTHAYLLHKHQISYCYSATLLGKMRERQHRQPPAKDFAAFAPFFTGDVAGLKIHRPMQFTADTLLASLRSALPGLGELRHSGTEVRSIQALTGGDVFYGEAATERHFFKIAGEYRVLHLATHGLAGHRAGDYSFLAFFINSDSVENGLLRVRDLYNLDLNTDMVVLSACETGLGELQKGEGIISLARAFAYAGAKSIVNTLWKVNDARTKDLMITFYDFLKKGKTKDEALRLAKLAYIENNELQAQPFFWAGLIGVGDMSAVW